MNDVLEDKQGWDDYWKKQEKKGSSLYGIIAEIYRRILIRRALNYFILSNFKENSKLLHAGCGSGQVDKNINKIFDITGLDISEDALRIYKRENPGNKTIRGSIFDIPAKDKSYGGIYNLGVMEHFREEEIYKILKEFKRVLKDDGKLVIFWPPEYGSSVLFLKGFSFVLNDVLKLNIKLHPEEISRIKSEKWAKKIFEESGFKVCKYYFGVKDMFTQAVIIAEKI